MKVLKLTPWVPAEASEEMPGAEHEQEQERLDQRGEDAQAVATEADQLAPPHDPDRAQLAAQAARRNAHAGDVAAIAWGAAGRVGSGDRLGGHQRPTMERPRERSRAVGWSWRAGLTAHHPGHVAAHVGHAG